jgi:hypothetical protein
VVLPGTNQHSPLDRLTPAQGKKKTNNKNRIINKQLKKKTHNKEGGEPRVLESGVGVLPHGTVNKQAGQRKQEWWQLPRNLAVGKLLTVAV